MPKSLVLELKLIEAWLSFSIVEPKSMKYGPTLLEVKPKTPVPNSSPQWLCPSTSRNQFLAKIIIIHALKHPIVSIRKKKLFTIYKIIYVMKI